MGSACLLALIAGYADTVGYLRYEAFAGLMTGNTILLGIDLATGRLPAAGFHAAIIGVFLAGVMVSRTLLRMGGPVWAALSYAAVGLLVCGFLDGAWAAMVLALAMGMQNSAANRFNGVALNTVFITGNLQKLGEGLIARLWPHPDKAADGVAIFALVWAGYAAGAALGAVGNAMLARPLIVPAAILPFVMMDIGRLRRFGGRPR
jgi:uncharacterized membrane protein YoaK (UPF0700 family)